MKKTSLLVLALLICVSLALPAFAHDNNIITKDKLNSIVKQEKDKGSVVGELNYKDKDGVELQDTDIPLPGVAILNMRRSGDVVTTYAQTLVTKPLKLKTECQLNVNTGSGFLMVRHDIDAQDNSYSSTVGLSDYPYNSNYDYEAWSYHTSYDASNGYTGFASKQDTRL